MKTPQIKTNNKITNKGKMFYFFSDPNAISQECEYISDEEIEKFMTDESPFGYNETYA